MRLAVLLLCVLSNGCITLGIDDCMRACSGCRGRMRQYHLEREIVTCDCEYPSSIPPGATVYKTIDRGGAVDVWFRSNGLPFTVTLTREDWQQTTRRSDLVFRTDEQR